jgi:hypothetical protein
LATSLGSKFHQNPIRYRSMSTPKWHPTRGSIESSSARTIHFLMMPLF